MSAKSVGRHLYLHKIERIRKADENGKIDDESA